MMMTKLLLLALTLTQVPYSPFTYLETTILASEFTLSPIVFTPTITKVLPSIFIDCASFCYTTTHQSYIRGTSQAKW
jgi:hypothetical protein